MSIGLLLAAWSGSNIFGTLMGALNTAYDVEETRSWIKQQLIRLGDLRRSAASSWSLSTIVFLDGEGVANWLGELLHLGSRGRSRRGRSSSSRSRSPGWSALAFVTFYLLPNVQAAANGTSFVAAIVTTVLWIVGDAALPALRQATSRRTRRTA